MPRATENSRRQHVELRKHAEALLALLDAPGDLDERAVQRTLSRMSGVLKVHVAMEIEGLYPRLLDHEDSEVRMLATGVIEKLKGVYEGFFGFRTKWDAEAVRDNRETFMQQARFVVEAFRTSTLREEANLYDRVDAIFAGMDGESDPNSVAGA